MSGLGPGPAGDINPGVPQRDLRDAIRVDDGYKPILEPKKIRQPSRLEQSKYRHVIPIAVIVVLFNLSVPAGIIMLILYAIYLVQAKRGRSG